MRHPLVGDLTLQYETLALPDQPGQVLVTYTAEAGSESQTALELLISVGAGSTEAPALRSRPPRAPRI
jgi:hypothetical protein